MIMARGEETRMKQDKGLSHKKTWQGLKHGAIVVLLFLVALLLMLWEYDF